MSGHKFANLHPLLRPCCAIDCLQSMKKSRYDLANRRNGLRSVQCIYVHVASVLPPPSPPPSAPLLPSPFPWFELSDCCATASCLSPLAVARCRRLSPSPDVLAHLYLHPCHRLRTRSSPVVVALNVVAPHAALLCRLASPPSARFVPFQEDFQFNHRYRNARDWLLRSTHCSTSHAMHT